MTKFKKAAVAVAVSAAAIAGAGNITVTEDVTNEPFMLKSKETVEEFRRHLDERDKYLSKLFAKGEVPQRTKDSGPIAIDQFEQKLLDTGFIDRKGGPVKDKPQKTLLQKITFGTKRAYAYTFGKETVETCASFPCSFTVNGSYGTGTATVDTTSKINQANSMKCHIGAANDGCVVYKDITSTSEVWTQFYYLIPTGFTWGASGYFALFSSGDGTGNPVYCNVEDYGTNRITCDGDELAYTDTGLNIVTNTKTRLEFRMKVSTTAGDVDIWVNNTTESSPSYNGSGTLNTGSQNITTIGYGGYHPDVVADKYYDDFVINNAFIGVARRRFIRGDE